MELFERIRYLSIKKNLPLAQLAEAFGVSPSRFNQWLNSKSQRNLWEHLPKLLALLPDLSREWLYFGEGEPFGEEAIPPVQSSAHNKMVQRIAELEAELREERRLNRQLITRLLADGVGDKGANNAGKTGKEPDNPC